MASQNLNYKFMLAYQNKLLANVYDIVVPRFYSSIREAYLPTVDMLYRQNKIDNDEYYKLIVAKSHLSASTLLANGFNIMALDAKTLVYMQNHFTDSASLDIYYMPWMIDASLPDIPVLKPEGTVTVSVDTLANWANELKDIHQVKAHLYNHLIERTSSQYMMSGNRFYYFKIANGYDFHEAALNFKMLPPQ